jgi:hypothetical protein
MDVALGCLDAVKAHHIVRTSSICASLLLTCEQAKLGAVNVAMGGSLAGAASSVVGSAATLVKDYVAPGLA